MRSLLRAGLESFGHEVVQAADGVEALEALERDGVGFDVIVSDVVMPRMGGTELLGRLLERRIETPVLLTSGWPDRAGAPPGRPGVDFTFLEKPFRLAELARALNALLGS